MSAFARQGLIQARWIPSQAAGLVAYGPPGAPRVIESIETTALGADHTRWGLSCWSVMDVEEATVSFLHPKE